jgi:glycosyltransferase involved in cell wall biosynthesis
MGWLAQKTVKRDTATRCVDLIIPVCDGEKEIEKKLMNCLELDYPESSLTITVVSDGSRDRTVEIVDSFANRGVRCIDIPERKGKVAAQNEALRSCSNEIIVFTDVSILVQKDAIKKIVSNFADDEVGAVSCRDRIVKLDGGDIGDSLYINYDMLVRKFTTKTSTLIGVTGGFYAVRRCIAGNGWEPSFPPDFFVALKSIKMAYRVVEDERVLAYYSTPSTSHEEMRRKIRTITRGMWALFSNKELMNPMRYGFVAVQLISHKLMRWLIPLFVIFFYFSNFGLWIFGASKLYEGLFYIQSFFYLWAIPSYIMVYHLGKDNRLFKLPAMWLMLNLGILISWFNYFIGKKIDKWAPTSRV